MDTQELRIYGASLKVCGETLGTPEEKMLGNNARQTKERKANSR
jgi:hypothetical protein